MLTLFNRLGFTRSPAPAAPPLSQLGPPPSQMSNSAATQGRSRRELLRVVLRDTLNRHGIPSAWFDAEVLVSTSRTGERGIHWRLVVKNPDPRLLTYAVALQNALIKRLMTFDPLASGWLTGVSWQYALPDEATCPAMPPAASWREPPRTSSSAAPMRSEIPGPSDAVASSEPAADPTRKEATDARADLEDLFAVRDADFRNHAARETAGDDATQPMFLGTEPAKL
jgi:hypothetical protein